MKTIPAPGQLSLSFFDIPAAMRPESGGLDIAVAVRETLALLLADAARHGHDRFDVATQVSRLSGRDMTKNMLDRYTSDGGEWRFPLEALPALTQATGDYRLLELAAEKCGCRLTRGNESVLLEIAALEMHERATQARLKAVRSSVPDDVMERLTAEVLRRIGERQS
jgi:hypothetical protein